MISVRVCTTSVVWLMLWLTHPIICYSEVTHILTTFHNRICFSRVKSKRRCISRLHVSPFRFPGQFQAQQYTLVLHVSHKYKFASTVSSVPTPAFILLIIERVKFAQKEKPLLGSLSENEFKQFDD